MYIKQCSYPQAAYYSDNLRHWKIPFKWEIDENNGSHYIIINDINPANIHLICNIFLPQKDIDYPEFGGDLYIRKTTESTKIVSCLSTKSLLSEFIDNIDHVKWYDLPFCKDLRLLSKTHPDVVRLINKTKE